MKCAGQVISELPKTNFLRMIYERIGRIQERISHLKHYVDYRDHPLTPAEVTACQKVINCVKDGRKTIELSYLFSYLGMLDATLTSPTNTRFASMDISPVEACRKEWAWYILHVEELEKLSSSTPSNTILKKSINLWRYLPDVAPELAGKKLHRHFTKDSQLHLCFSLLNTWALSGQISDTLLREYFEIPVTHFIAAMAHIDLKSPAADIVDHLEKAMQGMLLLEITPQSTAIAEIQTGFAPILVGYVTLFLQEKEFSSYPYLPHPLFVRLTESTRRFAEMRADTDAARVLKDLKDRIDGQAVDLNEAEITESDLMTAADAYLKILKRFPNASKALREGLIVFAQTGHFAALSYYLEKNTFDRDFLNIIFEQLRQYLARKDSEIYLKSVIIRGARTVLTHLIQADSQNADYNTLAGDLALEDDDPEFARHYYETAWKQYPQSSFLKHRFQVSRELALTSQALPIRLE